MTPRDTITPTREHEELVRTLLAEIRALKGRVAQLEQQHAELRAKLGA